MLEKAQDKFWKIVWNISLCFLFLQECIKSQKGWFSEEKGKTFW